MSSYTKISHMHMLIHNFTFINQCTWYYLFSTQNQTIYKTYFYIITLLETGLHSGRGNLFSIILWVKGKLQAHWLLILCSLYLAAFSVVKLLMKYSAALHKWWWPSECQVTPCLWGIVQDLQWMPEPYNNSTFSPLQKPLTHKLGTVRD